MKSVGLRTQYQEFTETWATLGLYKRFEQIVALVLSVLIAAVIVVSIWDLLREVALLLASGLLDPLDHQVFQVIFGQIMTVLIALEFNHSILRVVAAKESIVQVKTVLLIGVLALTRKFIILEPMDYPAGTLFALASILIVLGATYWLVRHQDSRQTAP